MFALYVGRTGPEKSMPVRGCKKECVALRSRKRIFIYYLLANKMLLRNSIPSHLFSRRPRGVLQLEVSKVSFCEEFVDAEITPTSCLQYNVQYSTAPTLTILCVKSIYSSSNFLVVRANLYTKVFCKPHQ